jgi:hypothetical protein
MITTEIIVLTAKPKPEEIILNHSDLSLPGKDSVNFFQYYEHVIIKIVFELN